MSNYFESRRDFARIINERGFTRCAEIGVAAGGYSDYLLSQCSGMTLYSIDEYQTGSDGGYICPPAVAQAKLRKYGDRSKLLIMHSLAAALQLAQEQPLDFVYIDGDHRFPAVIKDMLAYWPLIRSGGIMAGHDYDEDQPGVRDAVNLFAFSHHLFIRLTGATNGNGMEGNNPSWWFIKP
jgi:predicted O-methyltransferase YrrM